MLGNPGSQLFGRDDQLLAPLVAVTYVHVLDETHDHSRSAEVANEVDRRLIVDASLDDGVDLDRSQIRAARVLDPIEHILDAAKSAAHARKHLRIETVETDRDAFESGCFELGRVLGEQYAVGRQCDVFDVRNRTQVADQVGQVGAQQRLTARQSKLAHSQLHEQAREANRFIERQSRVRTQELVLLVEFLPRHAVGAAEVAAVHYRDAQVAQRPAERIPRRGLCGL